MRIERRRHFRQPAEIPARVRLLGQTDARQRRGSTSDLSAGGAMIRLDALPGWGLDLSARKTLVSLEIDLPGRGIFRCEAQLRRIIIGDEDCRLGVEFARIAAGDASILRSYLKDAIAREESTELRRLRRMHVRRRRLQTTLVGGLFLVAAGGLTAALLSLAEAFPEWLGKVRSAIRSEIRDAARKAVEDEARKVRERPSDSDDRGGSDDQRDPQDLRGPREGLTPEERERLEKELRERLERLGG